MFTGLIEDIGTLKALSRQGQAAKLTVETALPLEEIHTGDSIAVNGACLTVETVESAHRCLVFHTLSETLHRTSLGNLGTGAKLNLERAMRLGDRLGGHLVSGHVDAVSTVKNVRRETDDWVVTVMLPESMQTLVIPKGSITVDGISLTIAELSGHLFTVHVIPHTWTATNLHTVEAGTPVNLEGDMIGKYVLRQTSRERKPPASLGMNNLRNAGF